MQILRIWSENSHILCQNIISEVCSSAANIVLQPSALLSSRLLLGRPGKSSLYSSSSFFSPELQSLQHSSKEQHGQISYGNDLRSGVFCTSYFSVVVIKISWQKKLKEVYLSLQIQRKCIMVEEAWEQRAGAESRETVSLTASKNQSVPTGRRVRLWVLKVLPLSEQCHWLGIKCSNTWTYGEHFSFKTL